MSQHLIAAVIVAGSSHFEHRLAFAAIAALWLFFVKLSVLDFETLRKTLAEAVAQSNVLAGRTLKELADAMGISESLLARQLRAEPKQELSLARLACAWWLWAYLGPSILMIVAKRRWTEVLEDIRRLA